MQENFVRVQNRRVLLYLPPAGQPYCSFCNDAVSAVVQGDNVIVQCENGRTEIWQINPSGKSVMGPVRIIR
jgi:hypothetical protein